ncbi:MAG: TonB-dependent receptor [Saprospiraceae bacterium]|nr:TonB-dependent receptor [Saprospiraceae bacterium]
MDLKSLTEHLAQVALKGPKPQLQETNVKDVITGEDRIPTITLDASDDDTDLGEQNISGILSASRDPFVAAASFNLSTGGFEIRGYEAETPTLFNGILVNNLETGSVYWSTWGGLNDVTRNRESIIDLSPFAYSFGGVGGAAAIDTRASEQRVGKRVSYMFSNRAYTGRVMATWNTGMLPSGWAFSFSGSRRWANEGYVPGTFYDSYSYFASIDKKLNSKHLLNLTAIGAPVRRGAQSPAMQQVNDLAGTNFYNPNWGWQNGEKRNARVVDAHQPFFVLRHDWTVSEKATLTTAVGYLTGHYGRTQLDWFNSPDPRPDYYRKLPVYYRLPGNGGSEVADQVADIYQNNPDLLQIQWDEIYEGNRLNGQSFNNTPGNMSQVIIGDQRSDLDRLSANTTYQNVVSDHLTINFGLQFQQEKTHYFSVVEDLLGGDYYVNVDRFALDEPLPGQLPEYNLNDTDPIVREGDTYKWDYDVTGRRTGSWLQGQFSFGKIDFFVAGEASSVSFWRTGHYRNGRFPDSSFGDSEKQDFFNYAGKGGVTYKINGRNYLYARAAYLNRAPDIRNAYVSARSRDQLVPGLTSEEVYSGEAGYLLRSPKMKARATFFWTQFKNGLRVNRFYLEDDVSSFGTSILTGTDKRHAGVELALQYKITPSWAVSGVASVGEYIYTSRPNSIFVVDDDGVLQDRGIAYLKNFYVPSTPQTAYSGTLEYRSPNFWSASVTLNYFDRNYIDVNPYRRTTDAVFGDELGDATYNRKVDQERLPSAYTVDLFANKSWKINDDVFFNLTLGVTNLLNASFRTGGFEQLRFNRADFDNGIDVFAPKYFYAYGANFFLMGALRF